MKLSGSKMQGCKIRASYWPNYADIPAIGAQMPSGAGDIISRIFEVNGDTWVEFEIPYMAETPVRRTATPYVKTGTHLDIGGVSFSIINRPVTYGTSISTTIRYSLWCAAAEDMRFYFPINRDMKTTAIYQAVAPPAGTVIAQAGSITSMDEIFRRPLLS